MRSPTISPAPLAVLGLLFLGFAALGQDDVNRQGIPALVRPGMAVDPLEDEIKPDDPQAALKKDLKEWRKALQMFSDSLAQRQKEILAREQELARKERELAEREASIQEQEAALEVRERVVHLSEKAPEVRPWTGPKAPPIVGQYAMVIDAVNGRILHEKNARVPTPVASTQKLMTALIVCETGNLEKRIVIEPSDTRVEPSILGFKAGESDTRADLVKWLLVKSGNDTAIALARDNAGSVSAFAEKMNARARELGMKNSNFINPNGLPAKGQYSTARDMALLAWECYNQPYIRECARIKTLNFQLANGTSRQATSNNTVLRNFVFCNGMKTGYTILAGNCLISSAAKEGRERISVVLRSNWSVWNDSQSLLEWSLSDD